MTHTFKYFTFNVNSQLVVRENMKSINTKRIAAVAAGAALLGVGLAFAGPVTFQNVQVIGSNGQPLVQIVVGSKAQITDGIAAANIAAAIGNLAYTSVGVTATVNTTNANKVLHVAVTNPSSITLTNQQVYLNQSGAAYAAGSYGFSALIGSVLNRAVQLGSPSNTKTPQSGTSYAYEESNSITVSPAPSPYTVPAFVPTGSTVTPSTGGGLTFSTFQATSNSITYDNIMQVTGTQLPSLLVNSGPYGESESLWLTGFPIFNQQSSVNAFQLASVGGAYQAVFNKPIPWRTGSNTVNTAGITLLGQPWTILNYAPPGGNVNTFNNATTFSGTGIPVSSTATVAGGKIQLASSLSNLTTLYVGQNLTVGNFTVQLTDLGQPANGISPAAINLYYHGVLKNITQIKPGTQQQFNVSGHNVFVKVNQTFAGLYAYQKYAKVQVFSNVYTLSSGSVFNQTNDPGWKTILLWTNTSSGNPTQLQSIIIYNTTPTRLKAGQTFSFIQNPAVWNLEFIGDNLGHNYDPLTFTTGNSGSTTYWNTGTQGSPAIKNITEPTQTLTVTSSIPNAFSYSGQVASSVTYNLANYQLNIPHNAIAPNQAANVVFTDPAGFSNTVGISGITVQISGATSNVPGTSPITFPTLTFKGSGTQALSGNIFNVTAIQLGTAVPGLTVNVVSSNNLVLASLQYNSTPAILYPNTGSNKAVDLVASGSKITYNQQNGQPTANFSLSTIIPPNTITNAIYQYGTYTIAEYPVPSSTTSLDFLQFGIDNNSAGTGAQPFFQLNQSVGTPGTRNNVTYTPTSGGNVAGTNSVNVGTGFITERGTRVASIGQTSLTINYAKAVDQLLFAVSPTSSTSSVKTSKTYGPFSVGQAVDIPGVKNVTVSSITGTATLGPNAQYSITGLNNLTATPSVSTATQPVLLKNLTTTPLVVLDSQANPASSLILIGSGYVNSLSQQVVPASNYTPTTQIVQAFGNKIVVAGYTAAQTTAAANQFIQDLYAAASTS